MSDHVITSDVLARLREEPHDILTSGSPNDWREVWKGDGWTYQRTIICGVVVSHTLYEDA